MSQHSEEEMREAFEQFMISGKSKSSGGSESPAAAYKHRSNNKDKVTLKKVEKKYWQIINAIQGTLERDWLHVDDNLERVVSSISNLRKRIYLESRQLYKMKTSVTKKWSGCGYRGQNEGGVTVDDLELALSHDLLQHEKMMAGARMLLSSLSEAQEALARRLDELFLHHMDTVYVVQSLGCETLPSLLVVMTAVDKLQQVFSSLALELYRKQVLVQTILDAVNDNLLVREEEEEEENGAIHVSPRRVAEKCLREWPRDSEASEVNVAVLEGLLALGG
jgi:hypothetical protein